MSAIVFANVGLRYLTNASIPWSEEVARHMMIWLTFVGAGPVLRAGGHIAVDNLQDMLPRAAAIGVRAVVGAAMLALFVLLLVQGWVYMERNAHQLTAATQIPFSWVYASIPVGGALLIVHFLLIARGFILERRFVGEDGFDATTSASL